MTDYGTVRTDFYEKVPAFYRLVRLTKACRGETASAVKAHRKSPHRIRGWAKADDVSRGDVT